MLSIHTIEGWLGRIRYKPDTRFDVVPGPYDMVTIQITRLLPDSTKGLSTISEYADERLWIRVGVPIACNLGRFEYLPADLQFEHFCHWLRDELIRLERHETDEWFRVDNTLPYDPHKGDLR